MELKTNDMKAMRFFMLILTLYIIVASLIGSGDKDTSGELGADTVSSTYYSAENIKKFNIETGQKIKLFTIQKPKVIEKIKKESILVDTFILKLKFDDGAIADEFVLKEDFNIYNVGDKYNLPQFRLVENTIKNKEILGENFIITLKTKDNPLINLKVSEEHFNSLNIGDTLNSKKVFDVHSVVGEK